MCSLHGRAFPAVRAVFIAWMRRLDGAVLRAAA